MDEQNCKHEACHCNGADVGNNGFCSDACQRGEMAAGKCACGHADCQ
jgi:hypothetical protein